MLTFEERKQKFEKRSQVIKEIEQEILIAELIVKDLDGLYKKYRKAAYEAREERIAHDFERNFMGSKTVSELQDMYGYGEITRSEYEQGVDYLESYRPELSIVELHRKELKDMRDNWRGTIKELMGEIDTLKGEEQA